MFDRNQLRASVLPALRDHLDAGPWHTTEALEPVYQVLDTLTAAGVLLTAMRGPWRADSGAPARRRGARRGCVERGQTQLWLESEQRARELAGFLNWCEVEEGDLELHASAPAAQPESTPRPKFDRRPAPAGGSRGRFPGTPRPAF